LARYLETVIINGTEIRKEEEQIELGPNLQQIDYQNEFDATATDISIKFYYTNEPVVGFSLTENTETLILGNLLIDKFLNSETGWYKQ
jgi:hypothetical protein